MSQITKHKTISVLTPQLYGRFGKDGEIRCRVCNDVLGLNQKIFSVRRSRESVRKIYCMECARRVHLID